MARKGRRERENKRVSSSSFPWSLAPGQQSLAFRALNVDHFVQMDSSPFLARSARKPRRIFGSITSQLENLLFSATPLLSASSHEPGFRDLAVPLNPLWNFRCVRVTGRACSVPEISVFPTGIAISGLKIFRYEHFSPVTLMNYGDLDCIVLHCLLYFPHHKHPIQPQWYNFKSY